MSPHRGSAGSLFRPFYTSHFKGPAREPVYHPDDGYLRMYLRGRAINFFSPSDLTEYEVRSPLPAPDDKLRLEWVYGYRGKDSRNNLLLLPTGEIVYYIASVVVLYSAADHSQRHYLAHTAEVKCMTLHPNKTVIATGQAAGVDRRERRLSGNGCTADMEDITQLLAHVRVWDTVTLHTLHVIGIGLFERGIACLAFSKEGHGGQHLCIVDEAPEHNLSIWEWSRGDKGTKITESKSGLEQVVAVEFHPVDIGTIVSCGRGHISIWHLDGGGALTRKLGVFDTKQEKAKFMLCLALTETGDCWSGDSAGNVWVWPRGSNKDG
ncbi:PREDICTED: echinoderm microtubule-associated protein-like 1 [Priapulus caudatus]|uniref:Echinoderm microtubule-associated protein-like 1 n=1 Tax=Priapulus caudatus TaxID=37621 RepID=A0ABM1E0A6_PRICU|nr:PREDICTED: echinoderm microtubule-associated protein-like 1 [Priapulus caudatus]